MNTYSDNISTCLLYGGDFLVVYCGSKWKAGPSHSVRLWIFEPEY